jgi:RNA polymerase sigma-70 factor (ECF subfamily)
LDFEQAYDDHLSRVYGFLAYRTGSRDDAEDLTQQTFERAWRSWSRFDPHRARVSTWLISIARNLLIDHHRSRAGRLGEVGLDSLDAEALEVNGGIDERLGLEPELARALAGLSSREREVLALRYGADLRSPDIAQVMGLSVSNVQQITSRSLRRLRGALEGQPSAAMEGQPLAATEATVSPHRQKPEIWSDESAAVLE